MAGRSFVTSVLVACTLAACGGAQHATGVPPAPAAGAPSGNRIVHSVGPTDSAQTLTLVGSAGGSLTVTVPSGAVATRTEFTIDQITPVTAPGSGGEGFRVGPAGVLLTQPLTLTFTPPPGSDVTRLTAAQQGTTNYWYRHYDVTRDTASQRLTLQTGNAPGGDWALVFRNAVQDLTGTFSLTSTEAVPYSTSGSLTLEYIGEDAVWDYYIQVGSISAPSQVAIGGLACTAQAPLMLALPTSVAQIEKGTSTFYWSIDGHWQVGCSGGSTQGMTTQFDTFTPTSAGCTRTVDAASKANPAGDVHGSSSIDCGSGGKRTATWLLAAPQ